MEQAALSERYLREGTAPDIVVLNFMAQSARAINWD